MTRYHGYGHGLHYDLPHVHSAAYHVTPYASRFPTIFKNFHFPGRYALSHGGASVTSYNINYPKYAFHSPRPHLHVPVHSPLPRPLIPTPPVILTPKPVVPVALPTFSPKPLIPIGIPAFSNRVPIVISKPIPAPFHPAVASPGILSIPSQFIPFPIQPTINSFPATVSTPESIPLPGTTFVTSLQPDPWRPIVVNQQPTPTIATTPHIHRPAVNLLPPYSHGQADSSHQAQLELQQESFDGGYPEEHYAGRVSHLYLSPSPNSETNQPLLQQPQFTEQQDLSQIAFDHQGQERNISPFKYDPPSNNGQYTGPSSYEVELGSYTRPY
ncbi:hypothetical protein Bhyg_15096 [Pseudolycoriella hygida]|uniref:Uncharacterized protein n=1 Tax=Pseudolycoriella hygida TaxID=35572 RepID=A0A9Q0RXX1_9DIPT|nr:hypothetical protein Bhyg_15096 [Pseudolycoriella hygida]